MQLNSHKEVWALMWHVYSYEFKYLHEIESKYQINENKMEELFSKLCGYYTEIDENGKTIEKFSNSENMEKFNVFSQICQTAKDAFRTAINEKTNESNESNLSRQDYESISVQVIEQVVSILKESDSSNAKKYLPNILGTEIDLELLLNGSTNTLNTFINYFENQLCK